MGILFGFLFVYSVAITIMYLLQRDLTKLWKDAFYGCNKDYIEHLEWDKKFHRFISLLKK